MFFLMDICEQEGDGVGCRGELRSAFRDLPPVGRLIMLNSAAFKAP